MVAWQNSKFFSPRGRFAKWSFSIKNGNCAECFMNYLNLMGNNLFI